MEAEARISTQADDLISLSKMLESRAAAFAAVDEAALTSLGRLIVMIRGWIEEASQALKPYVDAMGLPWEQIGRYLRLGSLLTIGTIDISDPPIPVTIVPPPTPPFTPTATPTPTPFGVEGVDPESPVVEETPIQQEPIPIIPTQTPSPTPTLTPRPPSPEELRRRIERANIEYQETEPLEYIRHNVYWANDIDYYQMASIPIDNTLSLDIINDNSRYPGSGRIIMVMNMVDEQNGEFIALLDIDPEHIPNYEPVYLEELKRKYSKAYDRALQRVKLERFREVNILTDYFTEAFDGECWDEFLEALLTPGYE
jgi:hypothetical protein